MKLMLIFLFLVTGCHEYFEIKPSKTINFSKIILPPSNGHYKEGDVLTITVRYPETINVTGTPLLPVQIGSTVVPFTFSGTSGTDVSFSYTIQNADNDNNGIALAGNIDLNSGSIKNSNGTDANIQIPASHMTSVIVDTIQPTIDLATAIPNGVYPAGTLLDFELTFSEAVLITGSPRIAITIGAATHYATATTSSSSTTHTFRYTIASGDVDNNGILLTSPVELNSGTIQDAAGNNSTLTFTLPNTVGVLVDATIPTITSVAVPTYGLYLTGENLDYTVTFSEAVTLTGTPRLTLPLDSGSVVASAITSTSSTTHTFRYTILSADYSAEAVPTSPALLNGGEIKDSVGNDAVLTFTAPSVTWPQFRWVNKPDTTNPIRGITPLNDGSGKFYLWGNVGYYTGTRARSIGRIHSNFKHDITYDSSSGPNKGVMSLVVAQDGSGNIYAGGCFDAFRGGAVNGIVKIHSDGTKDTSFNMGTGFDIYNDGTTDIPCPDDEKTVKQILHTNDGSNDIFVVGKFDSYNGTARRNLIRLNNNGTIDATFDVGVKFNAGSSVNSIVLARDGSGDIILGGDFTTYDSVGVNGLIRLNSAGVRVGVIGDIANSVAINKLANSPEDTNDFYILPYNDSSSAPSYDGSTFRGLFRINSDATRDTGFVSNGGFTQYRTLFSLNRDVFDSSSIYVSGLALNSWNGDTDGAQGIRKIQSNGTQYPSSVYPGNAVGFWDGDEIVYETVQDIMGRGLVLAGGNFAEYNGIQLYNFAIIDEKGYAGGNAPYITNMSATNADSTITTAATNIDITLTFSELVTVTGLPRIKLNTSKPGAPRYATYVSGTGTATLTFRYITASGDTTGSQELTHIDKDSLFLNSGTIYSVANPTRPSSLLLSLPYDWNSLTLNKNLFINVP